MKRTVLGILAHVDAGKTTLAEALLTRAGAIRVPGRVDRGDSHLDTHDIERARGITIFSAQAQLTHGETAFTLLDAPGHVDFSAEAERTLQVLDYALLVVSANDGVASHTVTLWRLLERAQIPTFVFVNKLDLAEGAAGAADDASGEADAELRARLMDRLRERLSPDCVDATDLAADALHEAAAATDEAALDEYLEAGALGGATWQRLVAQRKVFPVLFGAALRDRGVDHALDVLDAWTQERAWPEDFGARVFKVTHERGERVCWLKVTGGSLVPKTQLSGVTPPRMGRPPQPWAEKVNQLRLYQGARYELLPEAPAGSVVAVTGLSHVMPGDVLGAEPAGRPAALVPVYTARVLPQDEDVHAVYAACRELAEEDPQLNVGWSEELQEVRVQLMGAVQLEVLRDRLRDDYGLAIDFGPGSILYKETVTETVMGHGHFEPLRHYAEVHLELAPCEGEGVTFGTVCSTDDLDLNWQRLALGNAMEREHLGPLTGAPLAGVRITLVGGRAHPKHTEGGDFRQATWRAVRQGLMRARERGAVQLLEPWYAFRLELPAQALGRALADLTRMAARFGTPTDRGSFVVVTGELPAAEVQDWPLELAAFTQGQGSLAVEFAGYAPCHDAERIIEQAAYDPRADLPNTPDSVFCAHGAGYNVAWDEVEQHMHVDPSELRRRPWQEATPAWFGA